MTAAAATDARTREPEAKDRSTNFFIPFPAILLFRLFACDDSNAFGSLSKGSLAARATKRTIAPWSG
jgi:hypothetical protein